MIVLVTDKEMDAELFCPICQAKNSHKNADSNYKIIKIILELTIITN